MNRAARLLAILVALLTIALQGFVPETGPQGDARDQVATCFYLQPRLEGSGIDCVAPSTLDELRLASCANGDCQYSAAPVEPITDSLTVSAFSREVEQLTGNDTPQQGQVIGQDSAVIIPYEGEVLFVFGDTRLQSGGMIPNSMARTSDLDASDGIDLVYYTPGFALPVLPTITNEATVWIVDAFSLGDEIYAYYASISDSRPDSPRLGLGTAIMHGGAAPFERTGYFADEADPLYRYNCGHSYIDGGYAYQYSRPIGTAYVHLQRIPVQEIGHSEMYEFWTGSGWSPFDAEAAVLFPNADAAPVRWSDHHSGFLAVYTVVFSPSGLLSTVAYRTAPTLTGPWSEETVVHAEVNSGGMGSNYHTHWNPAFSRENGRVVYYTSTKSSVYNVFLYELQFDYGVTDFSTIESGDDAFERLYADRARRTRARIRGNRLKLRSKARTIVGLRLIGDTFYPRTDVESAELVIPLRRPARRAAQFEIKLEFGIPNEVRFSGDVANELVKRTKLATGVLAVTIEEGDGELRISDSIVAELLVPAISDHGWSPGKENALPVYLTRIDSERGTLRLAAVESGKGARLDICVGACPAARQTTSGVFRQRP